MEGLICWKWRGAEHDTESTSHLFLGMRTRSNICVCPALAEWIADELRKESAISKERRKARGSKSLRRNSSIWGLGFYSFTTNASTFDPVLAGDAEFIYFVDIGVVARSAHHRGDLASGDSPIAFQSDLFQLPLHVLGDLRSPPSSASRSVRRRDESNAHSLECASDGLRALGQFCGRGRAGGGKPPRASLDAADAVSKSLVKLGGPPAECLPEGALRELLGAARFYAQDRADVQPYAQDMMSWPEVGTRPINLVPAVRPTDRLGFKAGRATCCETPNQPRTPSSHSGSTRLTPTSRWLGRRVSMEIFSGSHTRVACWSTSLPTTALGRSASSS